MSFKKGSAEAHTHRQAACDPLALTTATAANDQLAATTLYRPASPGRTILTIPTDSGEVGDLRIFNFF